jgi:plasmid maintenance system killer protein
MLSNLLENGGGNVVYSLPSTSITLDAEAECIAFTAGPYAKYAGKYFGIDAATENSVTYKLKSIKLTTRLEADPKELYSVRLGKNDTPYFLKFTSQGLVVIPGDSRDDKDEWRFTGNDCLKQQLGEGLESNLTDATNTLYKTVQTENGFEKVPVQQKQVVEKTLEQKAAEAAQLIFDLRKSRNDIITGNTDATFSGEALGAAIREIGRLEDEYLSLFMGRKNVSFQKMKFEVVPSADNAKQLYIAFRISDTEGLQPADIVGGRPIVLELQRGKEDDGNRVSTAPQSNKKGEIVYYRIPEIVTAKIIDGQNVLMQTRISVFQFGHTAIFTL